MFEVISDRMPRTPRRTLSQGAIARLDRFAESLDRRGANSRSIVRDASNDDMIRLRVRAA